MTRQQVTVWCWVCDGCGHEDDVLRRLRDALPDESQMRVRGWDVFTDGETTEALCPDCAPPIEGIDP